MLGLELLNGKFTIHTPVFMPVGPVGAVKSLDAIDLETLLKPEIILANTSTYISAK